MSPYEVREAKNGEFYWVMLAKNHEVLATSETYTRKEDAERGIADAQTIAAIEDAPDPSPTPPPEM